MRRTSVMSLALMSCVKTRHARTPFANNAEKPDPRRLEGSSSRRRSRSDGNVSRTMRRTNLWSRSLKPYMGILQEYGSGRASIHLRKSSRIPRSLHLKNDSMTSIPVTHRLASSTEEPAEDTGRVLKNEPWYRACPVFNRTREIHQHPASPPASPPAHASDAPTSSDPSPTPHPHAPPAPAPPPHSQQTHTHTRRSSRHTQQGRPKTSLAGSGGSSMLRWVSGEVYPSLAWVGGLGLVVCG